MSRNRRRKLPPTTSTTLQEKVNPVYSSITFQSDVPQPHTLPRNYKAYAREGYTNDSVYKCTTYITTNAAAIPPKLYTDRTRKKEITDHPLLDLLENPNPEQSGVGFREGVFGYLLIAGNSYQYAIRKAKNGPPDELWTLPPDRVAIIPSASRGIIGYKYEDFPDEKNPIPPENIGHLKFWNPQDPLYGVSPIEIAAILIDQQIAAKKWNLALLQNMAKPPGAWVLSQLLSPNDREKLKLRLKEEMSGYRNAGVAPLLDGGLDWKPTGMPPSDMDWLNTMKYNAGSIANIFNMPPQLIGDTSSTTYDNMEQAKAASYTEEIFPLCDKLYALWNMWLLPMYGLKGAYLSYDKESVEVVQSTIQAQKQAQIDRANKMWMSGECMLDEARELSGLPELPNGAGKVFRIGLVLVPADKLTDYAEQSLTTPAAPPVALAEPLDGTVPPGSPPPQPQATPANPAKPGSDEEGKPPAKQPEQASDGKEEGKQGKMLVKVYDADNIYQPDDLDTRLKTYEDAGAKEVEWECGADPCDLCIRNKGVVRQLGKAFPNGLILEPCHPGCQCKTRGVPSASQKSREEWKNPYRRFVEEVLV